MAEKISREQWVNETERLCPSALAFNAYVELEELIVEETDLTVKYKMVPRGKSSYATCYASAGKQLNIMQCYKGQCQLNWRPNPKLSNVTDEEKELVASIYEEFRETLGGKEGKGWETVKVLTVGEDVVHDAVRKVASDLMAVISKEEVASDA